MEIDQRFLLLCGGEVLVVAAGNLATALLLQVIVLAVFLGDRRGYLAFATGTVLFAATLFMSSAVALLGLAAVLVCGYAALIVHDYRLVQAAGGP